MQFIDLKAQYQSLKHNIDKRIQTVLDHGQYIMGPEVKQLETELVSYTGAEFAFGVANGTDALQLSLMALDIGPGDAVFTTAFSFFATAEVISLVGATPVFVDIDMGSYNICTESLRDGIREVQREGKLNAKAVIAVDMFGLPAQHLQLERVCKEQGLSLIDDGAQGFGGMINDRKIGSFADITTTSFFPAKPLGCYGDGGAVFTSNPQVAEKMASLRVHGKGQDKYDNVRIGMNSRLDTLQAAILLEKLAVFEREVMARNRLADKYSRALNGGFVTPAVEPGFRSVWAQYTLRAKEGERAFYMELLADKGIPSTIYYGKPLHQQTAYLQHKQYVDLTKSELASQQVFSLPMHPYMSDENAELVVNALLEK